MKKVLPGYTYYYIFSENTLKMLCKRFGFVKDLRQLLTNLFFLMKALLIVNLYLLTLKYHITGEAKKHSETNLIHSVR